MFLIKRSSLADFFTLWILWINCFDAFYIFKRSLHFIFFLSFFGNDVLDGANWSEFNCNLRKFCFQKLLPGGVLSKSVLKYFWKFTRKHLCQSLFLIKLHASDKVSGLRRTTLFKKRLWHRYFPVNFVKFLRTPFWQNADVGCFSAVNFAEVKWRRSLDTISFTWGALTGRLNRKPFI